MAKSILPPGKYPVFPVSATPMIENALLQAENEKLRRALCDQNKMLCDRNKLILLVKLRLLPEDSNFSDDDLCREIMKRHAKTPAKK